MSVRNPPGVMSHGEFIVLMALLMSQSALAIDAMLPALTVIGTDLGNTRINDNQFIISIIFVGLALGQVVYGPLSDSIGRKPAIYIGVGMYMLGCLMSLAATSFSIMLAGRLLQGLGIAAPRIVIVALIRDRFEGREMASVMSFIMSLFILVPVIAPALGQGVIALSHWRALFVMFLLLTVISISWFALRQPETLAVEKRGALSFSRILRTAREVCSHRASLGYTLASGCIFGIFLAFLSTSPQVLQVQYRTGTQFPLYFGVIALMFGAATFLNGKIVMRFGMQLLCHRALSVFFILCVLYWPPVHSFAGHPPLWSFVGFLMSTFFCIGLVVGNLQAMAMQPLGHIAGVGAAVVGSLSTFTALPIGIFIGLSYNGTVLPLVEGFVICGLASLLLVLWTSRFTEKEK